MAIEGSTNTRILIIGAGMMSGAITAALMKIGVTGVVIPDTHDTEVLRKQFAGSLEPQAEREKALLVDDSFKEDARRAAAALAALAPSWEGPEVPCASAWEYREGNDGLRYARHNCTHDARCRERARRANRKLLVWRRYVTQAQTAHERIRLRKGQQRRSEPLAQARSKSVVPAQHNSKAGCGQTTSRSEFQIRHNHIAGSM